MLSNAQVSLINQKLDEKGYVTKKEFQEITASETSAQTDEVKTTSDRSPFDNMTQREWVIQQLTQNGLISRNQCLRVYISRLADIIHHLEKKGWEFEAEFQDYQAWGKICRDYVYKVTRKPE